VPPALGYQPRVVPLTSAPLGTGCPGIWSSRRQGVSARVAVPCDGWDGRAGGGGGGGGQHFPAPVSCLLPAMRMCCSCLFPWRVIAPMFLWPLSTAAAALRATFHGTCPARSLHVCRKIQARRTCRSRPYDSDRIFFFCYSARIRTPWVWRTGLVRASPKLPLFQ